MSQSRGRQLDSRMAENGTSPWLRFLSRWSLVTAVLAAALVALFFIATPIDVPMDRAELVGALRRPLAHRLLTTFDSATWLGIGGVLLALSCLLARRAPVRSALVGACAVGQLLGSAGGFIRFNAVDGLAARYAAASSDQQAALVQTYGDISTVFGSLFSIGALLYGIGFVLTASVLLRSATGFPRWLAIWIGVSGAYPIIQRLLAVGGVDLRPYFGWYLIVGQIALYIAIAVRLWRPGSIDVDGSLG